MIWLFLKSNWRLIFILGVSAALVTYIATLRLQRDHARTKAENIQAAFDQFQAKVRVEGEAQKLRVAEEIADSERAKNVTVSKLQNNLDTVTADRDRLRDARARTAGSVLPTPSGSTAAANKLACFDRTLTDRALQDFIGEAQGLVAEGDAAIVLRDGWREWYEGQRKAAQ